MATVLCLKARMERFQSPAPGILFDLQIPRVRQKFPQLPREMALFCNRQPPDGGGDFLDGFHGRKVASIKPHWQAGSDRKPNR